VLAPAEDHARPSAPTTTPAAPATAPPPFVFSPLAPYRSLARRFFTVHRHLLGLFAGGLVAYVHALPARERRGLHSAGARSLAFLMRPFVDRELAAQPFPVQLRRRLEMLGPTYIKLGQIMAIREDLLPTSICVELQNLFDRLPPIPFPQIRQLIESSLERPLEEMFREIDPDPIGSASIAQAHRAETIDGDLVVIKVMKPGIRELIERDLKLLQGLGGILQLVIGRYQPRQIIDEFSAYTIREVDFTVEADNAETFLANFADMPDVVFPRVYREMSSDRVLTMEFLDGIKPTSARVAEVSAEDRARLIDLGASSIIRMLYQDGFFHADLHAGNLMILTGPPVKVGFIDLGMVGRFEEGTKRRLLYYYRALVTGDVEGAARLLTDLAAVGRRGDPDGFRRAVVDLSRRFVTRASRGEYSVAQLIVESVGMGGRFRVFFPVEMTLMVKALITFEGVGRLLDPKLNVAAVTERHVTEVFRHHFDPRLLLLQLWRSAPELLDLWARTPEILLAGAHRVEAAITAPPRRNPLEGTRSAILAAACIVGGVVALVSSGSPFLWVGLFALGLLLAVLGR
jgi:ubiquinone biosynthesis protein